MIVVVASAYDAHAKSIVAHWETGDAAMLSAEDLCRPGWAVSVPRRSSGAAVVGGRVVRAEDIHGILTLRPGVFAPELQTIHVDDRAYVAAELNAFLLEWLMAQPCPILNRPTLSCLAGPGWRPVQWIHRAAKIGIPVRACRMRVPDMSVTVNEPAVEVISVGGRCFGTVDGQLISWHLGLAREAETDLLCTRFSAAQRDLLSAHPWPQLTDPAVLAAIQEYFVDGAGRR